MVNKIKELIEARDYKNLKLEIAELNEVDIAEIIEDLSDEQEQIKIFRLLPKDIAADVFVELPIDLQQDLIMLLSNKEAGLIIDNLEADDAVDLVEEMPANVVTKILANFLFIDHSKEVKKSKTYKKQKTFPKDEKNPL